MLHVNNEYGKLRKVLMASVSTFRLHPPINTTQAFYYKSDPPRLDKLLAEQECFMNALKSKGIEIVLATPRVDCTNQLNTRDVAFVIGNKFVVSPMKEKERQNEHLALEKFISELEPNDIVLRPEFGIIEGGDIILGSSKIYVGISQRTNPLGLEWINNNFSDEYEIVPIYLQNNFLHLDVVFNILSSDTALVFADGIKLSSLKTIRSSFKTIDTHVDEQINLPTNVFSIDENTVIADPRNKETNKRIQAVGKEVIEIDFSEISKIGGSFRCSTCPINRD